LILYNLSSFLGFIFIIIALIYARSNYYWPGLLTLLPVIGTVLIINGKSEAFINQKILSNKIFVNIGLISYPLYLWHYPLISFIYIFYGDINSNINGNIMSQFLLYKIFILKICLILLSFLFSYCTYKYIEKPIRFHKNYKKYVYFLIFISLMISLSGLIIYFNGGFLQRRSIFKNKDQFNQISLFHSDIKNNCPNFNYIKLEPLSKCSVSNNNFKKTIAIVGDSHTISAYFGFEKLSTDNGFNSILLSWYVPSGELINPKLAKNMSEIINYLLQYNDINTIIIFLRGDIYLNLVPFPDYKKSLQKFVDLMISHGKNVYIANNNPDFQFSLNSYMSRPFVNPNPKPPIVLKKDIINKHKIYDDLLSEIKGAKLLNIRNILCPTDKCILFNETGLPLYYDGDHLSQFGSEYLAKKIIYNNLIDLGALTE
jgi:hypothetical protein